MQTVADRTFSGELNARVHEHLDGDQLRRAYGRLHRKAVVVVAWHLASYVLILMADGLLMGAIACTSLALSLGAVGFNIQHDANHNAFFSTGGRRHLSMANRIAGLSLNAIGGCSKRWIEGHVRRHHSSTNIVGKDDDIELAPFARFAPTQPWRGWHAFQHLYVWLIYGFTSVSVIIGDAVGLVQESISGDRRGRFPTVRDYAQMVLSKASFVTVMVVVPMLFHPWWIVVIGAVVVLALSGLVLGTVFQLAHAVEEADFAHDASPAELGWHEWQVLSTVDFCHGRGVVARAWTWYIGGLNYQTEHHLFPTLPHTIYPEIAPVVADVCGGFGIRHQVQPTMRAALRSHYRHMRALSRAATN